MIPQRYNLESVKRVARNPKLILRELTRVPSKILFPVYNYHFNKNSPEFIKIMDKDWDNLIILDACRYDYFTELNKIDGELSKVVSGGLNSWEFMKYNFVGNKFYDTVYVTANPHTPKLPDGTFHSIKPIYDNWTEPSKVVDAAIDAFQSYPNKRLIIHLMLPHTPHLGSTAEKLRERYNHRSWEDLSKDENDSSVKDIWQATIDGVVSKNELRQSYQENVKIALDLAQEVLDNIDGKSVITSDHGEMLGEQVIPFTRRCYGHPTDVSARQLRFVPWLVINSNQRREIISEQPESVKQPAEDSVTKRLRLLGYT